LSRLRRRGAQRALVGAEHRRIDTGGGMASVDKPEFKAINTLLGNLKPPSPARTTPSTSPSTPTASSPSSNSASTVVQHALPLPSPLAFDAAGSAHSGTRHPRC
jgi:hypothetical protein